MKKTALFPGSFDPFTLGHMAVAEHGLTLFDHLLIGIGVNTDKSGLLAPDRRKALIDKVFDGNPRVGTVIYEELTVDFCHSHGIGHILRGIRGVSDFEYEHAMEMANRQMRPGITTVAIFTPAEYIPVSSRLVREIITMGGDPAVFLPPGIDIRDYL